MESDVINSRVVFLHTPAREILEKPLEFEQALIKSREGDVSSLGELLDRYRPWLEAIASTKIESWIRPRLSASDVVQGSLIEAVAAFNRFEGTTEQELRAWLHSIFMHHLVDRFREVHAAKRSPRRETRLGEVQNEDSETPSRLISRKEEASALAEAILSLDDDLQSIVRLRYLNGLSFEQIGEELGISRSVASRRWAQAIKILANHLQTSRDSSD